MPPATLMPLDLDRILVLPWSDPGLDAAGLDPRSPYVDRFWLGVLGPSSTWLLRRLAERFDASPDGFELDLDELAGSLGLAVAGRRNQAFARSVERVCLFGMAAPHPYGLSVRRRLPTLTLRQLSRLPLGVQEAHRHWLEHGGDGRGVEWGRRVARGLVGAGFGSDEVERQLQVLGLGPALAAEAAAVSAAA